MIGQRAADEPPAPPPPPFLRVNPALVDALYMIRETRMSPTARSLQHLREKGYRAQVVEKWNPFAKIRQDLFGVDVLALEPAELHTEQLHSERNTAERHAI